MDLISAALVGILQGITEWLPISSSGQGMIVLMNFFKLTPESAFAFVMYLHLGTLLAVLVRFRRDVAEILKSLPRYREDRLVQFVIVSTIFTGLAGIPVYFFLMDNFRSFTGDVATGLVGILLIVTGLSLHVSSRGYGTKDVKGINYIDMVIAGVAQGFSVLPGLSRSGLTISALLLGGVKQENALKLSFIISIPPVLGAVMLGILGGLDIELLPLLFGTLAAFVFGYLTIDFLMKISGRLRFDLFCLMFGLFTVIFSLLIL